MIICDQSSRKFLLFSHDFKCAYQHVAIKQTELTQQSYLYPGELRACITQNRLDQVYATDFVCIMNFLSLL